MRLPLLLLLLFGISCAAPITINHEAAARKFFSDFSSNYTRMNNGAVADLVFEQFEKFFPGLISADDKKGIKGAFVEYRNKEDMENPPSFAIDSAIVARAKAELNKRIGKLDSEAKSFMNQIIGDLSVGGLFNMSLVAAKFTRLRTMYDSLAAKKSLGGQFEVFNRLDEAQALITIGDQLWGAVKTGCSELPEFRQCKKLKKKGLITYEEASSNHEGAAKKFYSQLFDTLTDYGLSDAQRNDAAFEILWEKFDKYFSGIVSAEDKTPIKTALIKYNEENNSARKLGGENRPSLNVDPAVANRVGDAFMNKLSKFNGEAQILIEKTMEDFDEADAHQMVTVKFADFRANYDASSSATKSSLSSQFEFFSRLDEVQALLTVGDRLLAAVKILCDNLSESGKCGQGGILARQG